METQAKKEKNKVFGTQPKARAGWPKRLRLVRATPWADFAVISVQLCLTMTAIFPYVALSESDCSLLRIIEDYCQLQHRPTI